MIFLKKEDLEIRLGADALHQIIRGQDFILDKIEQEVIGIIKEYLIGSYDIDYELNKNEKTEILFSYCIRIFIYKIYERIPDQQIPTIVIKEYDDTMEELKELSKGKRISNTLKILEEEKKSEGITHFRGGSNPKRKNY